jgi:hypothetical protein
LADEREGNIARKAQKSKIAGNWSGLNYSGTGADFPVSYITVLIEERHMKRLFYFALLIPFIIFVPQARALQAGPEEALEELATAHKIEDFIRHLPVKVQQYFEKMPEQDRAALADKLLISKNLEREGGKLDRLDDVTWELVEKEGAPKVTIRLKKTFISGIDALLQIEVLETTTPRLLMLGMRFEENEWRVVEVGEWTSTNVESRFLTEKIAHDSGAYATSVLRTLNTGLVTYSTTYPDIGYPASLQALSGEPNQQPTAEHAMLLDPSYLEQPLVRGGYEFRYLKTEGAHYQIVAVPQEFSEGAKSFFTDDTAVVRVTTENRPANQNDPPLE